MVAMTSKGKAVLTLPSETQIRIVREFHAPARLVYKAWTTPELIRRWWHAKRGVATIADVDLRVGGRWRWVMVTTEGGHEVAFHGEYREIVPDQRLVYTEVFEGAPGGDEAAALNTVTFGAHGDRCTVVTLIEAGTREVRDTIIDSGMEAGMQDALDLLEDVAISLA
jgi:uncharacterized protein YndB with AHSA1/START domain